jgi:hypothetical protein
MQRDESKRTEIVKDEKRLEPLDAGELRRVEGGAKKVYFADVVLEIRLHRHLD